MKQEYQLSDAIPDMPASFDRRVEDTLKSVTAQTPLRATARRPIRFRKKAWIAIAVAATLLITTTAVAAATLLRHGYTPETYMMKPPEEREPVQDVEHAIASANAQNADYTITMLPEMEQADELNEWRVKQGQPVYSEADWGWIREIRPEVTEVLIDGNMLVFNIKLCTDHGLSFGVDPNQAQMVDALCDNAYFTTEDGRVGELPGIGTGINPAYVTEDGAILYTEGELEFLQEPLPTDGVIHITAEIGIRDVRVADMGFAGLLGKIRFTFTFDASAGADAAEPTVSERALSGTCMLTYYDNGTYCNKSVSLDGVVLEETVYYRSTGIYVTYRVKSAPEGWTDADSKALLEPSKDSRWYGMAISCAPNGSGDAEAVLQCGYPNAWADAVYTGILPIFPSDYPAFRETGYELRLAFRCVDTVDGEPVDEHWQIPVSVAETSSIGLREQSIAVFPLPLP